MASRFNKLIDTWDPVLQKAFLDSVAALRDAAQISHVYEMLSRGDVEGALRGISLDPVSMRAFDKAISDAFEAGGKFTADMLPTVKLEDGFNVEFRFNMRNPVAEKWVSENSTSMVTAILDDQRQMIRDTIAAGLARGENPRTVAGDLVDKIGLTSSQVEWVRNYEDALRSQTPTDALSYKLRDARFDDAVREAQDSGVPIDSDTLDSMVTSYENRALRYRAETIARSETLTATHEASVQAIDQAIETGALDKSMVTKIWHATNDKRTRESHREMDGQEVGWDENFVSGLGNELSYPGDPDAPIEDTIQCRCWMETKVDFLAGIE